MPLAFWLGVSADGGRGIAWGWLIGYPVLTFVSALWALPVIGVRMGQLGRAVLPPVLAGTAMTLVVMLMNRIALDLPPLPRLALLVAAGGATYGLWLAAFARDRLLELRSLAQRG